MYLMECQNKNTSKMYYKYRYIDINIFIFFKSNDQIYRSNSKMITLFHPSPMTLECISSIHFPTVMVEDADFVYYSLIYEQRKAQIPSLINQHYLKMAFPFQTSWYLL